MPTKNVLVGVLLVGILTVGQLARADSDWEYWTSYGFTDSVSDDVTIKVAPELRYKGGFGGHYYTHVDIGIDWKVNNWFILGPYYRHVEENKNGQWKVEYRPHFNATFKGKIFGLAVSNRNRLEYRIKEEKEFFRYRNKLTLKLPKITPFKIQPYIADEPFYDFDADEINKNRLYVGFGLTMFKKIKAYVDYVLESRKKTGDWVDVNVLRIGFRYAF